MNTIFIEGLKLNKDRRETIHEITVYLRTNYKLDFINNNELWKEV